MPSPTNNDKPNGTFKCMVCKKIWDGSELMRDPSHLGSPLVCGDPFCGANVLKFSDAAIRDAESCAIAAGLGVSEWKAFL